MCFSRKSFSPRRRRPQTGEPHIKREEKKKLFDLVLEWPCSWISDAALYTDPESGLFGREERALAIHAGGKCALLLLAALHCNATERQNGRASYYEAMDSIACSSLCWKEREAFSAFRNWSTHTTRPMQFDGKTDLNLIVSMGIARCE